MIDRQLNILFLSSLAVPFAAVMAPAVLLPWRWFLGCTGVALTTFVFLWYASIGDTILLSVSISIVGLALSLGWLVQVFLRKRRAPLRPSATASFLPLVVAPLALVLSLEFVRHTWYRVDIPAELSVHAIYLPRGLVVNCEMSVWGLNDAHQISTVELNEWLPTPPPARALSEFPQDAWLNGIACSELPTRAKDAMIDAVSNPGAYFRADLRSGLVFVPSRAYIVHSFNRN